MWFSTFLLKNLLRRKTRTLLTSCGVAVAVGTTVALLGLSDSFERSTLSDLAQRGIDIIVVEKGVLDQLSSDLRESAAEKIRELPGVVEAEPSLVELVGYTDPNTGNTINVLLQGWRPGSFQFEEFEIVEGRSLQPGETKAILLGSTLAENVKKHAGDKFVLNEEELEVVGVFRSFSTFESGGAVMPLAALQEMSFREGSVTGVPVILEHGPDAPSVEEVVAAINQLKDEEGRSYNLHARPSQEYAQESLHLKMAHAMAWMTSFIAVFVGSIGMLNTMIMSVVERIREISILRAIGWRKSRVVSMILGESLILSMLGGVLGAIGAVILVRLLTQMPTVAGFMTGEIAPVVIAKGFILAFVVGVLGGVFPAYRAAQLMPSEGLRSE
ncbi:MAG: ABC transporter permease [Planctomycetes bacterium]|nr:ABC transporter permease [Planctomycetota bacterium]